MAPAGTLGRFSARALGALALLSACKRAPGPAPGAVLAFGTHLAAVRANPTGAQASYDWLATHVSWRYQGIATFALAMQRLPASGLAHDRQRAIVRSGLDEIRRAHEPAMARAATRGAAGRLRRTDCEARAALPAEVEWAQRRLAVSAPPGTDADLAGEITALAQRGARIDGYRALVCGGTTWFVVGRVDDEGERLVPLEYP